MAVSNYDAMYSGDIYYPNDPDVVKEQMACQELLYDYNRTRPREGQRRTELLRQMFAEIGEECYIEPPLHSNFGGHHVYFGKNIYANYNLTLVDDGPIYVGDYTMFAPNVVVATAAHPICPELREKGLQFTAPVHIGKNCWLGAGVIILPGVTVGDNVVIGAGSVVTRDLPSNVVAVGNPCRVQRRIGQQDRDAYFRERKVDPKWFEFDPKEEQQQK